MSTGLSLLTTGHRVTIRPGPYQRSWELDSPEDPCRITIKIGQPPLLISRRLVPLGSFLRMHTPGRRLPLIAAVHPAS